MKAIKRTIRLNKFVKRVNPDLDKYTHVELFKDKVEATKKTIQTFGLPDFSKK